MKKLKKLKIIEEGRFCSPEMLNQIRGGACNYAVCTTNNYKDCDGIKVYTTCDKVSMNYGYESIDYDTVCDVGYSYAACTMITGKVTCGSDLYYNSFPLG